MLTTSPTCSTPCGPSSGPRSSRSRSRSTRRRDPGDDRRAVQGDGPLRVHDPAGVRRARALGGRGGPARLRARLDHAGAALAVRHQQRHRRARPAGGRHGGAEGGLAPAAGVRRGHGLLRAHRGRRGLRSRRPADDRAPRRRPTGCSTAPSATSPTRPSPTCSWCSRGPIPPPPAPRHLRVPRPDRHSRPDGRPARTHKMGQFGAWTADVHLDDVRLPAEARRRRRGRYRPGLPHRRAVPRPRPRAHRRPVRRDGGPAGRRVGRVRAHPGTGRAARSPRSSSSRA